MAEYVLTVEELPLICEQLRIGDKVLLSGTVYTARDAAHKRFFEILDAGDELPINIKNAVIYYAGPTPAPVGRPIGSCGPTTSGRMDLYSPRLLKLGLTAMIGKGERSLAVRNAIMKCGAVYLCAVGGAGALAADCIKSCEVVAFEDLGCESVKRLEFENFPLTVANDANGGDIFSLGRERYKKT